jgi:hypothetical protein
MHGRHKLCFDEADTSQRPSKAVQHLVSPITTCRDFLNNSPVEGAAFVEVEAMYPARSAFLDQLAIHHTLQCVHGIFT